METTEYTDIKPKIHRSVISKYLRDLNSQIYLLRQREQKAGGDEKYRLSDEVKHLHCLKNRVLIKLIEDGFARVTVIHETKSGRYYCSVRIDKETILHMPIVDELAELLQGMYEEEAAHVRTENTQDDTSADKQGNSDG
jgi:hypothetical protein